MDRPSRRSAQALHRTAETSIGRRIAARHACCLGRLRGGFAACATWRPASRTAAVTRDGEDEDPDGARGEDRIRDERDAAQRAEVEATRANASKTIFLRMASHELRTPLQALHLQLTRFERMNPDRSQEGDKVLQGMKRSARRLNELCDAIQTFARIESDRLEIEPVEIDPVDLATQVIEDVRTMSGGVVPTIELVSNSAPLRFRTDPALFRCDRVEPSHDEPQGGRQGAAGARAGADADGAPHLRDRSRRRDPGARAPFVRRDRPDRQGRALGPRASVPPSSGRSSRPSAERSGSRARARWARGSPSSFLRPRREHPDHDPLFAIVSTEPLRRATLSCRPTSPQGTW